jgi:hypothetical protein
MVIIIVLSLLGISSCDVLMDILGLSSSDLQVQSVEPLISNEEVVGVRIILRNNGTSDMTVTYSVFLSADATISSVNDTKVFEATVDIPAEGQKQIDIDSVTQIDVFMDVNGVTLDAGEYFIGAFIDIGDTVAEDNETNNEAVSIGTYTIEAVYVDGTVTFEILNADDYNGATVYFGAIVEGEAPEVAENFVAGGDFVISSGSGSMILADRISSLDWIASGGTNYEIYFFIDVNSDADPVNTEPGPGDITSDQIPFFANGNMTVTMDLDTAPVDIQGAITGEINMLEAGGGTAAFIIVPAGTVMDENAINYIIASAEVVVDSSGHAETPLFIGYPPTSEIFFGTSGTSYDMYAVIDMNGDMSGNGTPYNDPYDYGVDFDFPNTLTYDGYSIHESYSAGDFVEQSGVLVELVSSPDFDAVDIYFAVIPVGGDLNLPSGTGELLSTDSDDIAILYNEAGDWIWQDDSGAYEIHLFADMNGNSNGGVDGPDSGDFVTKYDFNFQDTPITLVITQGDFALLINTSAGIYTEDTTHPIVGTLGIFGQDVAYDSSSAAVPGNDGGTNVLEADFEAVDIGANVTPWLHFNYGELIVVDTDLVTSITFSMNITAAGSFDNLQFLVSDSSGQMNGALISTSSTFYVSTSGDWVTYSVPLAVVEFDPGQPIDTNLFDGFKFGWPSDGTDFIAATIYFDNIYFE